MDQDLGAARYTMGKMELLDGVDIVLVAVGLFAVAEVLYAAKVRRQGRRYAKQDGPRALRPAATGSVRGPPGCAAPSSAHPSAAPAGGTEIPTFPSYATEKKLAKGENRAEFGTTRAPSKAAPVSPTTPPWTAALIPLKLTLGIPTSNTTAVLLARSRTTASTPGPQLFSSSAASTMLIASLYIGNLMLLVLNLPMVGLWAWLLKILRPQLYAGILIFATVGAYGAPERLRPVPAVRHRRAGRDHAPLRLPTAPVGRHDPGASGRGTDAQCRVHRRGSWWIFLQRPMSLTLIIIVACVLIVPRVLKRLVPKPSPRRLPADANLLLAGPAVSRMAPCFLTAPAFRGRGFFIGVPWMRISRRLMPIAPMAWEIYRYVLPLASSCVNSNGDHHRISAHRHASGPWHRYRYESAQPRARVIEHSNQEGLSYRFDYLAQPLALTASRAATRVSDSLDRIETYYFEGAAGLSRLIAHHKADGSRWLQEHDEATGRLLQSTDTAGATTGYQYDARGRLTQITQADGSTERYHYPDPQEAPLTCDSPRRIEDAQVAANSWPGATRANWLSYTDCFGPQHALPLRPLGALIEVDNALASANATSATARGASWPANCPTARSSATTSDSAGHLTRIDPAQPAGTSSETQTADPSIHLRYDLWGRLVQRTHGGLTLAFEYDSAGRLLRLVNENGSQAALPGTLTGSQEEEVNERLQRYR
ncbi:Teneurin-2 [Manis javanica]|nr:Teneurin-2 [Manis javanica]